MSDLATEQRVRGALTGFSRTSKHPEMVLADSETIVAKLATVISKWTEPERREFLREIEQA